MMNNQKPSDSLAAVVVAVLLILAAWGNAVVMLVVAGLGLGVWVLFYRKSIFRRGVLAATAGLVVAIAIALILLLQ
jgi:D-alanyl-lipoteichoic acid acyltransferase DltB (MBOAT superfamily)